MITGMDDAGWREWPHEVGATDIMGKPFKLAGLGQHARAIVGERCPELPREGVIARTRIV
jgi:hypothetical protein